ncbi:hypothetical protein ACE1TH_15085 [Shouchella sp. JSM 1781072]|uniref:hypothetical protein n=1 Tax=Shouchella sp. JSM 1781072 TaxID=3344581 RepID=UPI0035C2680D
MIPIVYDQVNGFGKDDQFFLDLLETLSVRTIADLGCGTGRLTAHFIEKGYHYFSCCKIISLLYFEIFL